MVFSNLLSIEAAQSTFRRTIFDEGSLSEIHGGMIRTSLREFPFPPMLNVSKISEFGGGSVNASIARIR